jgi:hypothetical protein
LTANSSSRVKIGSRRIFHFYDMSTNIPSRQCHL